MIKSILIILIIYFTIRILYNFKRENFQTKVEVLNSGLLVGENNITTTDQNFYFPKIFKYFWKRKNTSYTQDEIDTLNSKRLCIREGNDMECIDAHELVNALTLKDYRKNSACIDGNCLTKNTLDVLKSLTPSRHDKDTLTNKNKLKLKHGTNKCIGSGLVNAHTCATQTNRLKVTRTDTPPTSGWGQPLVVKGKKCISYYAAQEANPGSGCIEETITVGSKGSGPAYVDLPIGTYWKFPLGNGNIGVNAQHPRWPDTFRLEIGAGNQMGGDFCANENNTCVCNGSVVYGSDSTWTSPKYVSGSIGCNNGVFGDPLQGTYKECRCASLTGSGNQIGGDSLTLNSMNLIDCDNNANIKLEEGRDSTKVFTALGLINDDYAGSSSGQSQISSHYSH